MSVSIKTIPWQRDILWQGCLLAAIAHAIMVARYPDMANEHSWDGMNYSVQDSFGARGTVTFHPNHCIGAFREENRRRLTAKNNKLVDRLHHREAAEAYFTGAPEAVSKLAREETLAYLLDEIDGKPRPCTTTAFWSADDRLYSTDSYEDFLVCGGFLLAIQCQDAETGIQFWQEEYDMSDQQVNLLRGIFERKLRKPAEALILSEAEMRLLAEVGEIGILFPDSLL